MRDNSAGVSQFFWLIPLAALLWLLYLLSPILAPFMFAAILAYICNPMVGWLEKKRIPRSIGAVAALLLLIGAFVGLVLILAPLVQRETQLFIGHIPAYLDWLKLHAMPWLQTNFGIDIAIDADEIKAFLVSHMQNARDVAAHLLPSLKTGGLALLGIAANILLVPVVFFYVLRDWGGMLARIERLIPRRWHALTTQIVGEIDTVLSEFLRGQIAVMLLMSVYYVIALHLAGLEFALPIGLVTGLLVFIPYLGIAVGIVLALVATLMQFQGVAGLLPVLIAFGIGQALEGMAVTPLLVGERIGLHPVAVIFALLAFGQLFGFFGVLLALPASAALLVALRHLRRYYLDSSFYR
ncbi:MAG TPA: AI-2E family transporter [Novimethylophilus sp.]|jgi:predicted PurR-regulated permease PerM|uniref:AI-2E family transporter n=1 Tax=Novimethylophilus sp. TaxID=2137426 RepID=UPI002F3F44DB